ncbi:TIGR03621 family F420-dependent LLM class oxidoreductase [Micromonospora sp. NPDC092111]|uniref:TIGR03621 family F420-dependent LLM class oxidoreductase n=1 Tax=Micromonospora sp. NPDC092111 TaxID=3364289 RepID=UPI0038070E3E
MPDRPFRFGVLANGARDIVTWRDQARTAEALGYHGFLVPDHLGREWGPLVSLAVAAEATRTIALGTLVLGVDLRVPTVLFKELATLAQLAPGRLEIGLGAGWLAEDYTRAGVPMAPASTRIERLDEAATMLRTLWTERRLSYLGRHYQVTDAVGEPATDPAGVRWVLGGGGRRMLTVAAAHADVVSLGARLSGGVKGPSFGTSATIDRFDERLRWVRDAAGPRFAGIELQCLVQACAVTSDRDRYASRVLARMFGLDSRDALDSPLALVGTVEQLCDRLTVLRDRLAISYWVVPAAQMKPFADVVARLAGR